jgi:hypothetical protein
VRLGVIAGRVEHSHSLTRAYGTINYRHLLPAEKLSL